MVYVTLIEKWTTISALDHTTKFVTQGKQKWWGAPSEDQLRLQLPLLVEMSLPASVNYPPENLFEIPKVADYFLWIVSFNSCQRRPSCSSWWCSLCPWFCRATQAGSAKSMFWPDCTGNAQNNWTPKIQTRTYEGQILVILDQFCPNIVSATFNVSAFRWAVNKSSSFVF